MKRTLIAVALGLFLSGCATVTLNTSCPSTSTGVAFALAGSTVGNQVLSMLGSMGSTAGLMAKQGAAIPVTSATMTYKYFPIFGADSGSLNCTMPPQNTTVVTSPPASIVR